MSRASCFTAKSRKSECFRNPVYTLTNVLAVQVGAVAVALVWTLLPQVACFFPEAMMTAEEHECCELMAGECDQAMMPQHQCCRYEVRSEKSTTAAIHRDSHTQLEYPSTSAEFQNASHFDAIPGRNDLISVSQLTSSPPGNPASSFSVLRI